MARIDLCFALVRTRQRANDLFPTTLAYLKIKKAFPTSTFIVVNTVSAHHMKITTHGGDGVVGVPVVHCSFRSWVCACADLVRDVSGAHVAAKNIASRNGRHLLRFDVQ